MNCQETQSALNPHGTTESPGDPVSILLDSPAPSNNRVSFNLKPEIKAISPSKSDQALRYEIKEKTLLINKGNNKGIKAMIKQKAKKYVALVDSRHKILLKYRKKADIDVDLKALGLKMKSYIENKLIVTGIGFKETEESVAVFFGNFSGVEKVVLEKNSKGYCTGKGTVTLTTNINTNQEFRLNGRLLRIERIKKQVFNTTRLHISHMSKNINISRLRSIMKGYGFVPENIRIDLADGKNKGYGFIEFRTPEDAERFIHEFERMRDKIGARSYVEYSKEKIRK